MDDYSEEMRLAREAHNMRRKKLMEQKRKREKKLRSMKRMIVAIAALSVLTAAVFCTIGNIGEKSAESSMNAKATLEVAVDANNSADDAVNKNVILYPYKSPSYQEITDPGITSANIALLNVEDSQLIAGKGAEDRIYPASMTKVMTIIIAAEHLTDLTQTYSLSNEQIHPLVQQQASRAGFDPGEVVTVKDLFYGLILPSGADAAVALSNLVAGSEESFANLMNEKCNEIGLKNTHFCNASGLFDENQYTTPLEMAMIMQYAMSNPVCAEILSTYQYRTTATEQHPEGILLSSTMFSRMYGNEVEGMTIKAGKTGYTDEAGNCLVTYAEKQGKHYIVVIANGTYKWNVIFDDFTVYRNFMS